jgi:Na+-driven multidrug efflux pump
MYQAPCWNTVAASALTQLNPTAAAVASLLSTLLAPVYNYIFIFSCGFGLAGAAFANGAHHCSAPAAA